MKQEAEMTTLSNLNIPFELSFPDILTGQLSNGEKIYFESHAIAEDNDCGFHALGLERDKAVTQLLAHAKNEKIRRLVASEIQAAFLEGTLPKEMQDSEYQNLWQIYNVAWENYRQTIVEVKEEIRKSNEGYFSAIQLLTPDALITWFDKFPEYSLLKERLLKVRLDSVFPIERKLDVYCEKEETFKAFVTHYLNKGGWLTYIGNYQNKTQQTSSLDALAELNRIQLFIWQANPSNLQQLYLVHQYGKLEYPAIHMLHTHEMTHYNLLQQIEKPIQKLEFSQAINKIKEQQSDFTLLNSHINGAFEKGLSFSGPTDTENLLDNQYKARNYEELLQQADIARQEDEVSHKGQSAVAEKLYAQALRQAVLANRYDQQEECLKSLGDIYLSKKAYTQACALYNAARIRCEKMDYTNEKKAFNKEVLIHRIKLTEKLFLENVLNRVVRPEEISSWETDKNHKQSLERLRQWCKKELEDIDREYPLDQIYKYGEEVKENEEDNERETKLHELQLAKAERIRNLYQQITKEMKELIRQMLAECIQALGKSPCQYAILGLGSLAREEATPYSDLEFAILIAEEREDYKEYFRNLTKLFHLKVINFGETILPSMAIPVLNNYYSNDPLENWFYDDVTPRGFAFDAAMPQACKTPLGKKDAQGKIIYELIHTPEEMVKFLDKKAEDPERKYWFDYEPHLTMILMTADVIEGTQALWKVYEQGVSIALQQSHGVEKKPLHQSWALQLLRGEAFLEYLQGATTFKKEIKLKGDIREFHINPGSEDEEGKLYDVKKEIYRFPDRVLERLAIYFGVRAHVGWERIQCLGEQEHIHKSAVSHLKITISIALELRLRAYLANEGQQEVMAIYGASEGSIPSEQIKDLFQIPSEHQLFRFYFTALPLYQAIMSFSTMTLLSPTEAATNLINNICFDGGLENQADVYKRLLNYSKAKACLEKWHEKYPGNAEGLIRLGVICKKLGDSKFAIEHSQNALMMQKQWYGEQPHPAIVDSLNNLGTIYQASGQSEKAMVYYEQALAMGKKLHEGQSPRAIADSLHNLGATYQTLGQTAKAIEYYGQALTISQELYGKEPHPAIARSFNNLGAAYDALGQFAQAITYHNQALVMKKQLYGKQPHPDIAASLNNLGNVYQALGQSAQAIAYYGQALTMQKQLYGKSHPDIAASLNNLGNGYKALGQPAQAMAYYEQALAMRKQLYGKQPHPAIAYSLNNMGLAYQALGQPTQAMAYYEQALTMQKQLYGKSHPDIAGSLNNLGNIYRILGQLAQAIAYFGQALTMQKQLYGKQLHPDIAASLNNLGTVYKALDQPAQAMAYYEQALVMRKQLYGKQSHPDIADSLNNLGNVYQALGQTAQAIIYHEQALTIQKQWYGKQPYPDIAGSLNNLGNAYDTLGQPVQAMAYYDQALVIQKQWYGEQPHPDIAGSLNNLGTAYNALGQPAQAISLFQQSHSLYTLLLGKEHRMTKQVKKNLVDASLKLGNRLFLAGKTQEAKAYYKIIEGDPEDITLQQTLLALYYGVNDLMQVIGHAAIMTLLNPMDISAHHNLGCLHHIEAQLAKEKGNEADYQAKLKQAEASFQKALSLAEAKPYSSIFAEFGNFLYQKDCYKEALIYLLKAIELKVDNRGLSYGKMEKPTVTDELKEEIDFRSEIQLKAFVLAYRLLVSTYKKLGQITEAEKVLSEFVQAAANEKEDLTFMLLGHAYSELKQFELAKTAYQNAIQYYKPIAEYPTYMLAENYLRDQQKLNEVKQEVDPKAEVSLAKEDNEELSVAIALSLNISKEEKISTNYSSAALLAHHSGIYGSRDQISQATSQSTASPEEQALSLEAEEEDFELEEAPRLSLGNN